MYGYESKAFCDAIEVDDWKFTTGSFTDASNLAGYLDRCCVNLSVGYDDEHTPREHLNLSYLTVTLNFLFNGVNAKLYDKYYEPDFKYQCQTEDDYFGWGYGYVEKEEYTLSYDENSGKFGYASKKGRESYQDPTDSGQLDCDEVLDHLPAEYWEDK
jgi:hypothetical protein